MKRILVGVDGSNEARNALRWARELARSSGAQVTVATAICVPAALAVPELSARAKAWEEEERRQGTRTTAECVTELEGAGVSAVPLVAEGSPAETLAQLAREGRFDLIVVGHRGRGAVARYLTGSVADRLVQIADRPVVVVR